MAYSNEIDENKSMPKERRKLYRGIGFLHNKDLIRCKYNNVHLSDMRAKSELDLNVNNSLSHGLKWVDRAVEKHKSSHNKLN